MSTYDFVKGGRKFILPLSFHPKFDAGVFALKHVGAVLWDEDAGEYVVIVQGVKVFIGNDDRASTFVDEFEDWLEANSQELGENDVVIGCVCGNSE